MPQRLFSIIAVFLVSFSGIQCFLGPDNDRKDQNANKPPTIQITAGAVDSAEVDYRIDFRWQGYDDDGFVKAYEYAIDDTTLEEAWQWIGETGMSFKFLATIPSEDPEDPRSYTWHQFFVRAVDDDLARSSIDSRLFNAKTIAPKTRITSVERVGCRAFLYQWEGEDLDASDPELKPEFYEYKLALFDLGAGPVEALLTGDNILLEGQEVGDKTAWIRVSSETTEALIDWHEFGQLLVFGVRAIDEAGAVEPSLDLGENCYPFEASCCEDCIPTVIISDGMLGSHTFPTDGERWVVDVPAEESIRFSWICDLSHCGDRIGSVNYGFDIPDPGDEHADAPDGIGGWIGWSHWDRVQAPVSYRSYEDGRIHHFYLKVRDSTNDPWSERFCWVQMNVVAFPMNKTVLIVDDATPAPSMFAPDPIHDAFRNRVLRCIDEFLEPGEEAGIFNVFRDPEIGFNPESMPLRLVASFKMIIWNNFKHNTLSSGLRQNEFEQNMLSKYVAAGGCLYLYGSRIIGGLANDNYDYSDDGLCPNLPCVESPAWDEGSFIWRFLHLTNCVKSPSSASQQVDGWVGAQSVNPVFPDIRINTGVWDPWEPRPEDGQPIGGTPWFEVYKGADCIPIRQEPGLDTIYIAKTFNYQGIQSELEGHPCALRYESTPEDSAQGLAQGRVFLQMFPFFPANEMQATEAACKALTWLMTGRDE